MNIVLWDTRRGGVTKDFAGGFGVGEPRRRGGLANTLIRRGFVRDRRPVTLRFAYLAAIFRQLGHTVEYALDRVPAGADVYVFHPALATLPFERQAISQALERSPGCRVLVTGIVAHTLPEAFDGLDVTLLRGECERLLWRLDEVLADSSRSIDLGRVADLDALPRPDWSLFEPRRFRVAYDFWKFPTAFVESSRGCSLRCNYCPYIVLERSVRLRRPERVVAEIEAGQRQHGFRSFKFRDPLFGLDRAHAWELADRLGRLNQRVQFSIETRIDLLNDDLLIALCRAGLSSITFGVETPDEATLRRHRRAPVRADRQEAFIDRCRQLGIRTVVGFMIGFPDDTEQRIAGVLDYARRLNPTFANFNVVTPYPGTEFFGQVRDSIATFDYSQYTVYQPVLVYRHLTPQRVAELGARCFVKYYFRSRWLQANAPLVWPALQRWGIGGVPSPSPEQAPQCDGQGRPSHNHGEECDPAGRQHAA